MKESTDNDFNFYNKLIEIMEENDWNQIQLSERADIPQSTIATWFRRKNRPSFKTIKKICDALGMTLDEFFNTKKSEEESAEEREGRLYLRVRRHLPDAEKEFLHDMLLFVDSWLQDNGLE